MDEIERLAQREETEWADETSLLRVLASAGTTVLIFDHTLNAMLSGLKNVESDLEQLLDDVHALARTRIRRLIGEVRDWRNSAGQAAARVGLLLGEDVLRRRRRVAVREAWECQSDLAPQ